MNAYTQRQLMKCRCGSVFDPMVRGLVVDIECPEVCCNFACITQAAFQAGVRITHYCIKHFIWHMGVTCPVCDRHHKLEEAHG